MSSMFFTDWRRTSSKHRSVKLMLFVDCTVATSNIQMDPGQVKFSCLANHPGAPVSTLWMVFDEEGLLGNLLSSHIQLLYLSCSKLSVLSISCHLSHSHLITFF